MRPTFRIRRVATLLLAILGFAPLLLPGCRAPAPETDAARAVDAEALVVLSDLDNPPFADVAPDGTPIGRDVEMMAALAGRLGRTLEWRQLPYAELLASIEAGEADVVCATIGITPERAERVRFSRPYFVTSIAVVVRAWPGEPSRLADLSGKRVAAAAGTTSEDAVRLRLPQVIGVFENKDETPTGERLTSGAVDAAVMDGPAADTLVAATGGRLARLSEDLGVERYALVLPRGAGALLAELDAALVDLEREGFLLALDRRHGLAAGTEGQ